MSDRRPVFYDEDQSKKIQEFIAEEFGGNEGWVIAHEIESEYVHTDVAVIKDSIYEGTAFVTFGAGARKMQAPVPALERTEYLMLASSKMNTAKEIMSVCLQMQQISKYPFANDTWLGHGHTINASEGFMAEYGYPYFIFVRLNNQAELPGLGPV